MISANINFQILLCYSRMLLFSFLRNSFMQFRILLFPFEFCYSFFWFYYAITNFFYSVSNSIIRFRIMLCSFPVLLFDCTVLSCSLESYYFLSNSVGYLSNSIMPLRVLLGPVHTYPEIFVSANVFMRIHQASIRVRRIRSVYPEISVYALQSGNFCIRCVSGYVWTLVSVYFCIRWRHTFRIRYVWTQIFL